MQVLMETHEQIAGFVGFAVVADGPVTRRPLEVTRITGVIDVFPALDAALAHLGE
ncbi:MAG: hypothetical protein NVS4B6_16510 [Mycobacterium sp.]